MIQAITQLDQILRGQATRISALRDGLINISARRVSGALVILGMIYGLCMGSYAVIDRGTEGLLQLLATTLKVPLLFFLTLLVTFPSLYVFNALVGSRLTIRSVLRLLVASLAVTLTVLASFGTIVAFFSASTKSYPFILLLNIVVFGASGILGLAFLLQTLHRLTVVQEEQTPPETPPPIPDTGALDHPDERPPSRQVRLIFRIWVVVFGLVAAQMAWVLRPFLGHPNLPFTLFRQRESNFFEAVQRSLAALLGF